MSTSEWIYYAAKRVLGLAVMSVLMFSCANMGSGPQGGPKDITPPSFKSSNPNPSSVKVKPKKIEIQFDEYVMLKDQQNIVVSPMDSAVPDIRNVGKKIIVEFNEPLKDSTTYTIDFAKSIVDFRESNPIPNYYFEFSTGDVIDSFMVSGNVTEAFSLVPSDGFLVVAVPESVWTDTTMTSVPARNVGKTDKNGRFVIRGLKEGRYRVYAVNDDNSDRKYTVPGEMVAFAEDIIETKKEMREFKDTIYKKVNRDSLLGLTSDGDNRDTLIIDSVKVSVRPYFLPDSLSLRSFVAFRRNQSYKKAERKEEKFFTLYFDNSEPIVPEIRALNFDKKDWFILQPSVTTDTMKYWIRDTSVLALDTIRFEMKYKVTDSTFALVDKTDTVQVIYKRPKANRKDKEKKSKKIESPLVIRCKASVEMNHKLELELTFPLQGIDESKIVLWEKTDTLRTPIKKSIGRTDNPTIFTLDSELDNGKSYVLSIDSAAFTDIYNNVNDSTALKFRLKDVEEYSNLTITLKSTVTEGSYVELLDKDVVKYRTNVKNGQIKFNGVLPGNYVVRLVEDTDGDGTWTTGDVLTLKSPENVWFFEKSLNMNANWDYEEEWDLHRLPIYRQRPVSSYPSSKKRR